MKPIKILLFDVDGVLVNPRAYRAAIGKTLTHLCSLVGLHNVCQLLPTEKEIARMESCGVHDVWDMTNIIFCSLLCSISTTFAQNNRIMSLSGSLKQQLSSIASENTKLAVSCARPDYYRLAENFATPPGCEAVHPPSTAHAVLVEQITENSIDDRSGWIQLLNEFLSDTRSPYKSYGTRLFQNIVLGKSTFEATYELPGEHYGSSLITTEDVVLIDPSLVATLRNLFNQPDFRIGIYTARPSHPPRTCGEEPSIKGYSPEAELALRAAGMEQFPLVGMGCMEWLAHRHGDRTEELTKPNTTQALAALTAAVARRCDAEILEKAYWADKSKETVTPFDQDNWSIGQQPIEIYVFEDTVSGIRPMLQVAERLQRSGRSSSIYPFGIATDQHKIDALMAYSRAVFADVNAALNEALDGRRS